MKKILIAITMVTILLAYSCRENKTGAEYVAKVGDIVITKDDVLRKLNTLPPFAQEMFKGEEGMKRLIDEMVKTEILYFEAKKKGIDREKEYKEEVEDFKKITLIRMLLRKELENRITITDEEIKDFYEKNKKDLKINGRIVDYNSIKDRIRQHLIEQKQAMAFNDYVNNLEKNYKITLNDTAIKSMVEKENKTQEKK